MTKRNSLRALGLSAAIIVGAGGSLAASPAFAAPTTLPTAGAAFEKFEDKAFDAGASGVGTNAAGEVVLAVDQTSDDSVDGVKQITKGAKNVKFILLDGPIKSAAQNEIVGGAGYGVPNTGICSIGFSAWTPDGKDAFLTAGHCGDPGQKAARLLPEKDVDFHGSETEDLEDDDYTASYWEDDGFFGEFKFSQFGAKGNTNAKDEKTATDIAVIDKTDDKFKALPRVTGWGADAKAANDLAASSKPIRAIGTVDAGDTVHKSGRTSGHSTDKVVGNMVFFVGDSRQPETLRWVKGFMAEHSVRGGDSGGSWYNDAGEALGISSATGIGHECETADQSTCTEGEKDYAFVADLSHGLKQTPGYEVKLEVDAPTIENVTVAPGATVNGKTEANATAEVAADSKQPADFTAENGNFSFTAPEAAGEYEYTFIAKKGQHNRSEPTTVTVTVEKGASPSPTATDDPTSTPSPTATEDPTSTPSPTATENPSDDPVKRALAIDPENIKATDFVKKDAVEILATGCTPGTEANLEVTPRGSNVTGHTDTATVDEDGNVGFTVYGENADMPNAYIGEYDVTVSCDGGDDLTGTFTVTEAGGKDDDGKGGDDKKDDKKELPRTGSEALGSLGAAAALIAGGAGLYVLARRRKN